MTNGTLYDDVMPGSDDGDIFYGLGGNDTLLGAGGDDELRGGADDDSIVGGAGNDVIDGGLGDDRILGGDGFDWAVFSSSHAGGAPPAYGVTVDLRGQDVEPNHQGSATGSLGNDVLQDIENVLGSLYADTIYGSSANNWILTGGGADSVFGMDGDDVLVDNGDNNANSFLHGGTGSDFLELREGSTGYGGLGEDTIQSVADNPIVKYERGDGVDFINYANNEIRLELSEVTVDQIALGGIEHAIVRVDIDWTGLAGAHKFDIAFSAQHSMIAGVLPTGEWIEIEGQWDGVTKKTVKEVWASGTLKALPASYSDAAPTFLALFRFNVAVPAAPSLRRGNVAA